ncbi:MAG: alpha/beta hydrolase [Gammaproteobacteria bacterium]|nr:alpha/beta hydrolase [Gammaproteobacteria bacterium]
MISICDEQPITVEGQKISVSLTTGCSSRCTVIFGHGAGAGMRHASLDAIANAFADIGISTLRFNFPYMEAGRNRVDSLSVSIQTFKEVYSFAVKKELDPLFLGGHSFGGRMATHAVVEHKLMVKGLILSSFPLHNPKKPSLERASHFDKIECPILFLIGTRDGMANADLIQQLSVEHQATLKWLDTADHGYKTLKRTRTRQDDVFQEIAVYTDAFVSEILKQH